MPILRQLSLLSGGESPVDFPCQILGPAWPGNVRELEHYLERAVVATTGPELSCKGMVAMGSEPAGHDLCTVARGATCQAERARILQALQHANRNRARTAKFLKISRASLYNKIRDYQIECPPSAPLFPTSPFRPLKKLDALRR